MSKMCKAVYYLINGRKKKTGIHVTSRIYEALKTKIIPTWIGRHHSIKSRQKTRNTMIKNGITGKRTWLNKNGVVKYVLNSKVDEFIKNGWEHGRPGYKPRKGMHGKTIWYWSLVVASAQSSLKNWRTKCDPWRLHQRIWFKQFRIHSSWRWKWFAKRHVVVERSVCAVNYVWFSMFKNVPQWGKMLVANPTDRTPSG